MSDRITRVELTELLASGRPIALVEALGPAYWANAHLPGAVNIPPGRARELAPLLLPRLDAEVIVYCSGTCQNSEITAEALGELGYSDVRVYEGGKEDWMEHGLPVERST